MGDKDKLQQLSEFIDGDCDDTKMVTDTINNTPRLVHKWERYHLIGDTLRNSVPDVLATDVFPQVKSKLDDEPQILVTQGRYERVAKNPLALAASLAAIAFIGSFFLFVNSSETDNLTDVAGVQNNQTSSLPTHVISKGAHTIERLSDPRISPYLAKHNAAVRTSTRNIPLKIRVVTYPR